MRYSIAFFFLFFVNLVYSQSNVTLKGRIVDGEKLPLEAVTLYLTQQRDSSLVEYSFTDQLGKFEIKIKPQKSALVLKANMIGFEILSKSFNEGLVEDRDLGDLMLQEARTNLDELVIQAEIPPLRVKKDTLEFNASSFKVRPDANLDELIRQLPGVQVDEEKNITVNGKSVSEILVNGKPFFSEDGKIALENLPADIINKVQVTDKKSKKEKFTKELAESRDASINITIDDDKNKGHFGRVSGGYGTNDRYESALFLNMFNKRRKISLIGSANNINAGGFSRNEVFDNMTTNRSGGGITESRAIGANLVEELSERWTLNGSYDYNHSETSNANTSEVTKFLPSGTFTTNAESRMKSGSEANRGNVSIDYEDDKNSLYIMPSFSTSSNFSDSNSREVSYDEVGERLNKSEATSSMRGSSNAFNNTVRYTRKLKKEGQFFSVDFANSNSSNDNRTHYESETVFFQSTNEDDIRRQFKKSTGSNDSYNLGLEYSQPITDSLRVSIGGNLNYVQGIDNLAVYDYDAETSAYDDLNELESNKYKDISRKVSPFVNFSFQKSKYSFNLRLQTNITKNTSEAFYNKAFYKVEKNYIDPAINSFFTYRFNKNDNFDLNYNYNVSYQNGNQLLAIENISNPLNTSIGNPDLKPTGQHRIGANYRSYNFQTRMGYSLSSNLTLYKNSIVSSVLYDEDRKSISTFKNVNGDYRMSFRANWYGTTKIEEHQLRYGIAMRLNYTKQIGFIDGVEYSSKTSTLSPSLYVNYDYGELVSVRPSYSYNYYTTSYTNFSVKEASNYRHNLGVQVTTYWPKQLVVGNDFAYTYNSQIAKGFQRDFYMWNLSVGYDILKDRLQAKVKVYDVLNQNTSAKRTIDPMQIVDSESLVLKQYMMFSLVYKLNKFSKEQSRQMNRMGRSMRI